MEARNDWLKELDIGFATAADVPEIRDLLRRADLPYEDFEAHLTHFLTARRGNLLLGVVGLERAGAYALLRSLAVADAFGGRGLGRRLCHRILEYGRSLGLSDIYLLTTTAADFFKKLGFEAVDRARAPAEIRATQEFSSLCPATAICMRLPKSVWERLAN